MPRILARPRASRARAADPPGPDAALRGRGSNSARHSEIYIGLRPAKDRRNWNTEAEQALLGAILIINNAFDCVASLLEPNHFFDQLNQKIIETASKLIASAK